MATQSTHTMNFPYPPDLLLKVITSDDFQVANFLKQGHVAAKTREVSRTDDRLVMEAEVTEYAKGITGIDKSKTEQTTTTYEWDLKRRTARWTYKSAHGERVKVWGQIRLEAAGDGSRLHEEFNVSVKIPLAGGKIEKMVLKEVDKYWPKYEALVHEYCKKAG